MLAVSGVTWALFSGVIAGSLLVIAWGVLRLIRQARDLGRVAGQTTGELNRAMEEALEGLRAAEDDLNRIRSLQTRE